MGISPLSWQEIIKWADRFYNETCTEWLEYGEVVYPLQVTHCTLLDYELDIIKDLSSEYSSEYAQASDPQRECPKVVFKEDVSEEAALANASAIEETFKLLFGPSKD